MENLKGNSLAEKFSVALNEKFSFYALPPKECGDILSNFMDESAARGVQAYYEMLASLKVYPSKFNPNMKEILEKLPVKMTSIEDWIKMHKDFFIN